MKENTCWTHFILATLYFILITTMTKYKIILPSLIGAISLVVALSASAQVGANVINKISTASGVSSSTIRARLEARYGTSTPIGAVSSSTIRAKLEARYGTSTLIGRIIASTTHMTAQNRVAAIQGASNTEIANRIDSLNKLLLRINSMVKVSASDKAGLTSSLQTEIANLTSLKNSIDTDNSTTSLKDNFQSITKSYRVYMLVVPQASITAAADRVLDLVSSFNTLTTKLQGYITTAQSSGVNVSSAVSAMALITVKVTDAGTQANAAISEVSALQPDQGATSTITANTAALKDAQSKIKAATADLTAARKDVTTVANVIKDSMKIQTNASVSASTTTQ